MPLRKAEKLQPDSKSTKKSILPWKHLIHLQSLFKCIGLGSRLQLIDTVCIPYVIVVGADQAQSTTLS